MLWVFIQFWARVLFVSVFCSSLCDRGARCWSVCEEGRVRLVSESWPSPSMYVNRITFQILRFRCRFRFFIHQVLQQGSVSKAVSGSRLIIYIYIYGTGVAQFVERPTEKPGAILTRARVPGAARDFSPRVSFQCSLLRCLYSPRVQLHVSTSVCMLKNPKHWQTYLYFDTCKYCAHS